jgi:hypothetical protein
MSDLDRILKLASHGTADAHSPAPAERELKDVPVVAEDDSQDRQLEAWCKKWSKYKGGNGDPLPMGWVLSKVDSGITTDGIEQSELDMNWEEDRLPITNAMQDEFIAIMGNDDEETMHEVYDVVKSACMEPTTEAVGEFAEPIYDLIDMHFEGDCQPVFDDLVRFLSGDQIKEFVDDFRRHHELPMGDDMDEAQQLNASDYHCDDCGDTMHKPTTDCGHDSHDETGSWWKDKDGNGVPDSLEEAPNEGNEFSGALAQAKKDGKKEFEVDGKKYKVEEAEETEESEAVEEAKTEEDTAEEISEAPTMDTTQLITLLKNAGLSEEKIKTKLDEWANTPAGAAEEEATSHGEPYENFAQSVNLSLKRYLDAEDMKVGLKEHKVEDIKEAYKKSKGE